MLDRLKVLVGKFRPHMANRLSRHHRTPSSSITQEQRRAYTILFEAMREHMLIYVRPLSSKTTYQSVILDVNPNDEYLLIDELFPETGFQVMAEDRFEVSIGKKGHSLSFVSELLRVGEYAGAQFYKLALPAMIEEQQRRSAFRVEVPLSEVNYVKWAWSDGAESIAYICDISASGLRLEVGSDFERIRPGIYLAGALVHIGSELAFHSDIEVKYVVQDNVDKGVRTMGGEFMAAEVGGQQALQHYMHKLQRAHRRQQLTVL